MKRLFIPAALVAAVLGVTLLSASGSAKPAKPQTFTVIERDSEGHFHFLDNPPRAHRGVFRGGRISSGDEFVIFQPLRSPKGTRVGALEAICTAARGGQNFGKAQFACHGSDRFKNGTLALEALFSGGGLKIAVTGGTGIYQGASGSVGSVQKPHRTIDTVNLVP
jgi:hypothetical protein